MVQRLLRRPIIAFALSGLVAVVMLGVVGVVVLQRQARTEAVRDARSLTASLAKGVVEPALEDGLLLGDPVAVARLDRAVRDRVLGGPVVRVKLWAPNGRIVYSDASKLMGQRFELEAQQLVALRTGSTAADVSDLSKPENRLERGHGPLLEVYRGIRTPAGGRLLFEIYELDTAVQARAGNVWRSFAPAMLGVLVVLWLAQLPLAASLARRLQRGQREREALLHRAVAVQAQERRRVAADLHDGPVQDLAGVSFALSAAREHVAAGNTELADRVLAEAGTKVRGGIRGLRSLFVDLYPPALSDEGLPAAVADLVAAVTSERVTTDLTIDPGLCLPLATERVLFRGAQEALRNVARHADASHVTVRVQTTGRSAVLEVADDGRGFDATTSPDGHLGLRLLEDLARDTGGALQLSSRPGLGTTVRLEIPVLGAGHEPVPDLEAGPR